MKYLFVNNKSCPIKLPDKNGKLISFAGGERKVLDEYFRRYVPKQLSVMRIVKNSNVGNISINRNKTKTVKPQPQKKSDIRRQLVSRAANKSIAIRNNVVGRVGLAGRKHATEFSVARIEENSIAISNNIGIGILSFNRLSSLMALIESIRKHTDLNKTTIFVSDESTDDKVWSWLQKQNDIIAFHNDRKGIAVNSNRLLRCLSRFKHKMILNDDVEVIKSGWDSFYFDAMERTGIKHFCYRQSGIYGATRPKPQKGLIYVDQKPHGAVMAIHEDAFRKVGYFDESFGKYGFEHVDYSDRIARACHDKPGYFDAAGSDKFFKIYNDATSDPNKHENYANAKSKYEIAKKDPNRVKIGTSKDSEVSGMTCIIPFRDTGRSECMRTVVNNIRSQRYPVIQIILAEQDDKSKINLSKFPCVDHVLIKNWSKDMHFCKSVAFNNGAALSKFEKLVLHDADMLVRSDYFKKLSALLDENESAHIGETVCYMEKESTDKIVKEQSIDKRTVSSDRIVKYYEGGSFGITRKSYHRIGGFCEDFIGYGCFTENNFVITSDGLIDIKDVQIDDYVLTHTGEYHQVTNKFVRNHKGTVYDVFIPGRLPIKGVTKEHPFLINKEWIKAEDLKIGMKSTYQPEYLDLVQYQNIDKIKSLDNSKNEINVDFHSNEFSWFVGIFLAEGVVKLNKAVYLYIAEDEDGLLSRIIDMVGKISGHITIKHHYVKNGCREVRIFSSKLAKIINAVSPKSTARNKVIAKWYLDDLNIDSKLWLLNGLIDGDGDKQHGSKKRLVYTTGSINLANIVSMIMSDCGITHSFGIRRTGGFIENDYYSLTINRNCEKYFDVIDMIKENVRHNKSNFGSINDIKERHVDELVYNLEVECDNSYVVNGVVVHNCEDTEFFKRMVNGTKNFNTRSIDLFHLWHDRTSGWIEKHDTNKAIQTKMFRENKSNLENRLRKHLDNKYKW